mmetsp:Transcript_3513/g.11726  ORF Transcript_3513/g.11726 Transcript_3513/m.11726 type:complete len:134 (-) Transcript_3513:456-857(-)
MENIRKRHVNDVENANKYATTKFAKDLLNVADNLERAISMVPAEVREGEPSTLKALLEGVELTDRELLSVFRKHGVDKVDPAGQKFDPNFHEALYEMPVPDAEPGTVARVESVGYKIHDRCLRPAKVGVVSKQ